MNFRKKKEPKEGYWYLHASEACKASSKHLIWTPSIIPLEQYSRSNQPLVLILISHEQAALFILEDDLREFESNMGLAQDREGREKWREFVHAWDEDK